MKSRIIQWGAVGLALALALAGCGRLQQARLRKMNGEAEQALERKDYDAAERISSEVIAIDPHNAVAFYNRSRVWLAKNERDKAMADADAAVKADPGYAAAHTARGFLLAQKKDLDKAIAEYDLAIRLDPAYADNHTARGYLFLLKQDYDTANAEFNEALRIDPKSVPARVDSAVVLTYTNRFDEGVAALTQLIADHADSAQIYFARGSAYRRAGRSVDALADFDDAIRLDPSQVEFYTSRAEMRNQQRDAAGAMADAEKALALNPGNATAYYERGSAHALKDELDAAIADFKASIAADPSNAGGPHLTLGMIYELQHDEAKALPELDAAVAQLPGFPQALLTRARVRAEAGDYIGDAADLIQLAKLPTAGADEWNNLAWLLATCPDATVRNGKKAVEDAMKACELSQWQQPGDIDTLAAACAENGDFDKAVKIEAWYLATPGLSDTAVIGARIRLAGYQAGKPWRDQQ